MEQNLTIILVEDDASTCDAIQKYVDHTFGISLIETTNNIIQALSYASDYRPDAVILDLELHEGGGNGLAFLEQLNALHLDYMPFVLVTTHNNSQVIHDQARSLGADFILAKYQEDYHPETAIDFLKSLAPAIRQSQKNKVARPVPKNPEHHRKQLERIIFAQFDRIGINPKVLGRKYLAEAILLLLLESSTVQISSLVATRYKVSTASVERAMQTALDKAWKTANIDDLYQHYTAPIRSDKGVPTCTEFIYYYAEKIRANY